MVTSQKLATTIATTRHHTRPALQTNKTVSPRAETPSRQFAQVFAQICSRAAEHVTLAGNIFLLTMSWRRSGLSTAKPEA